ncbi:UDP-N-acetylmuramoyl-tripeptide--D-alanyl-D-alanine ligase [Desulfocurvus sp.]|uniref:UDP-N-acetylmuramoyl-tripeptide--D-alanyl-D- alanine ligase n=1 Tax=Desulfocurvus sp. TaxID=2871698 RepID=UPI0025C1F015|nr:UDP-N-acetylmuramoyl-tripeptide--D-alanyl-D-alanine ligase [Desulfocurvus sp.]MCK9238848.1 UDP-N-acetylmuramoyl-tripeptide--D-alanyl-D-alanine ligase [Desulfocurvus sp.]
MNLTLAEAAAAMRAVGDVDPGREVRLTGICTDSRLLRPGQLFFCLAGENYDAHAFAPEAARSGAAAVVVSRPVPEVRDAPVLMVRDVLAALGDLGALWRGRARATVVAVTGSAGKTTVKELLAAILSELGETARNYGNFNNLLGVPLTMLGCTGQERFWVLELGINVPGEMEALGAMVRPDAAVIANIGPAHLEGLGSLEGVAAAKTELLRHLAPGGRAFVSADHPPLLDYARAIVPDVRRFTAADPAGLVCGRYLGRTAEGLGRYFLRLNGLEMELTSPLAGAVFAENIVAAASVAFALGAGEREIARGVAGVSVPGGRFDVKRAGGWTLVDDSYNANPLSMRQAVDNARELAGEGVLALVLGEMRELGAQAGALHREMARAAAAARPAAVFFHGAHEHEVARGLEEGGFDGRLVRIGDPALFAGQFLELGFAPGVALFKGSRGCRMERFLFALAEVMEGRG